MAIVATAVVVCAIAICALLYAVVQLRRQVDTLARQVADLAGRDGSGGETIHATVSAPAQPVDLAPGPAQVDLGPAPVPVITAMNGQSRDDVDLSVSRVASVTLALPLIKVAAFSHGVRKALDEDSRMRIAYAVRKELKRQRKLRRRRRAGRAPSEGWRS